MNEKTRILVVDDDPHLLQGMSRILKSAGYETIEAATGTDCLRFTIEQKPDLVLLDVMLPDINGIEVCKRIKLDKTLADIYVVLLSSLRTSSDGQAVGLETGADGYIARPVSNRALLARVESLLRLKRAEHTLKQSEEKYRLLADNMEDVIWQTTPDLMFTYISPSIGKQRGYDPSEVLGRPIWEFLAPNEIEPIKAKVAGRLELLRSNRVGYVPEPYETEQVRKDGTTLWTETMATPVFNDEGQLIALQGVTRDITERKRAEEELRGSEEKYRNLVESISDVIFEIDKQGVLTYVSPVVRNVLGYEAEDLIGKTFLEFVHPDDRDLLIKRFSELTEGVEYPLEYRLAGTSGEVRHVRTYTKPIMKESTFEGARGTLIDITDRKRAEDALAETNKRYRLIAETIHDCFWMATPEIGKIVYVSPAYEKIWGRSCESLYESPTSFIDAIHPNDRDRVIDVLDQHRSQVTAWNAIYRIVWPDGSIRWVEDRGFPVLDENGKWYLNIGVATDITERKRAEEELRNQKQVMEVILDNVPAMMVFYDAQGHCRYVNRCLQETLGWSQEELGSRNLLEECYPDPDYRDYVVNYIASAKGTWGDFSTLTRYGHQLDTSWANLALPDGSGVGIGIDITERRRAEEDLRISEEKFSKAFFLSPDAISVSRLVDGMLVSVNEGFKQIFGYAEAEVIGKTSLELDIWDKPEHRNRWTEKLKSEGKVDNFETRFRTKDGDIRCGLMSASIIELNGVEHILNVTRDITERKLAQEELKQSEEKYRLLAENMNDVIWQTTPDMVFTYVSPSVKKQRGYEASEVLGRQIWDFIAPNEILSWRNRVERPFNLLLSRGDAFEPEPYELHVRKDGTTLWTETTANPVFNDKGDLIAFQGVTRDITERKLLEEALRTTLGRYHTILSSLYAGVLVVAEDGRVEFANQAFCDLFHLEDQPENLRGLSPPAMIQKIKDVYAQPAYAMSRIQAIVAQGDPVKGEEIAMRDGRFYLVDFVPIHIDGKPCGRMWHHQDITERKRAEDELRIISHQLELTKEVL